MTPHPTSAQPDPSILLALVSASDRGRLEAAARSAGFEVIVKSSLGRFLEHLAGNAVTATLLSLADDTVDEALARRVGDAENSGTLLLSAPRVTLESALLMERVGAVALLHEPLVEEELVEHLARVRDEGELLPIPGPVPSADPDAPTLVGSGESMGRVVQMLARVAPTPSTVLITGESGTGKEVVARVLHWASPRRDRPFVAVNCAAIPEHLLESELFGHEKGAFTGAVARRVGRFERAHGGTIFLDEIGDMSPVLQAKILRVLEERRLERVGSEETLDVDVRIVAATNRALSERIESGDFREDLYYRLAVVELDLPPLRDRGSDIRELVLHFAAHFSERYQRPLEGLTGEALRRLETHHWPGNVRELRNVLDRAVLLSTGGRIHSGDLRIGAGSPRSSARAPAADEAPYPVTLSLAEVEASHIARVLRAQEGHMGRAADVLGIHRNTLTRKVQEYDLLQSDDDAPNQ